MTTLHAPADLDTLLRHRGRVRLLARRLLADEHAVDDVEQDTWTAALDAGPREPAALGAWLGRIAERFALQRLRGEGRRARREGAVAVTPDAVAGREPADIVAEADAHAHVVRAVVALEEPYRTTVVLRYFDGCTVAGVAERTGVPLETARTRLRRAHEMLRARLEREHGGRMAILGPLAAAATSVTSGGGLGLGGALAGTAALAAAVVAGIAGGAWLFGHGGNAGAAGNGGAGGSGAGVVAGGPGAGAGVRFVPPQGPAAIVPPVHPATIPPEDPPPANGAEPAPPAEPADARDWIARDLANGKPLAGMTLKIRTTDASGSEPDVAVTTDAKGRVPHARELSSHVFSGEDGWRAANPEMGWLDSDTTLWMFREAEVEVRLRRPESSAGVAPSGGGSLPWPPTKVEASWAVRARGDATPSSDGLAGSWWCRKHGIPHSPWGSRAVATDGVVRVRVPLLRDVRVVVAAKGFLPAVVPVPIPERGTAPAPVVAELHEAPVVHGVVTAGGVPKKDVRVILRAIRMNEPLEVETSAAAIVAGGFTWHESPTGVRIERWVDATTDADGRVTMRIEAHGVLEALVREPGYRIARVPPAGVYAAVRSEFRVDLVPDTSRYKLVDGLTDGDEVEVTSHDDGERWRVRASGGTIPVEWLESGKTYGFEVRRTTGGPPVTRLEILWGADPDAPDSATAGAGPPLVLRDVADGRPVAGVKVRVRRRDATVPDPPGKWFQFETESGADGRLPVKSRPEDTVRTRPEVGREASGEADWRVLDAFPLASNGTLWLARETTHTVRVSVDPGAEGETLPEVSVFLAIDPARLGAELDRMGITDPVHRASISSIAPVRGERAPDGAFSVRGWRVPGATIVARADGRVPAVVPVGDDGGEIAVTLRRAPRVTLRIRTPDGPLPEGSLIPITRMHADRCPVDLRMEPEVGWEEQSAEAPHGSATRVRIDATGTASLFADPRWDLRVSIRRPGFRRFERRLGHVETDVQVDGVLERTPDTDRPTIRTGGAPVGRATVRFISVETGASIRMDVGEDSRLVESSTWLDRGAAYLATMERASGRADTRRLTWTGADIDWDALER